MAGGPFRKIILKFSSFVFELDLPQCFIKNVSHIWKYIQQHPRELTSPPSLTPEGRGAQNRRKWKNLWNDGVKYFFFVFWEAYLFPSFIRLMFQINHRKAKSNQDKLKILPGLGEVVVAREFFSNLSFGKT